MEKVRLGKTDLDVTRLGIGLSEIGTSDQENVTQLLMAALESGINFFDTSSCYRRSEEFTGKALSNYRDEIILVSKCGHSSKFKRQRYFYISSFSFLNFSNYNFKDIGYLTTKDKV